jgi:hypothetical protein
MNRTGTGELDSSTRVILVLPTVGLKLVINKGFCVGLHINTVINTSTQSSTHQHINTVINTPTQSSTHQHINTPTNTIINTSRHQQFNTSTQHSHHHVGTQHKTSTRQHNHIPSISTRQRTVSVNSSTLTH